MGNKIDKVNKSLRRLTLKSANIPLHPGQYSHCCAHKCLALINDPQRLVYPFQDAHRKSIQFAISDRYMPSVIADIIISFLENASSKYPMICHRAVAEYFGTGAICKWTAHSSTETGALNKEIRVCLYGEDGAGKSHLISRFVDNEFRPQYHDRSFADWDQSSTKIIMVPGIGNVTLFVNAEGGEELSGLKDQSLRECDVVVLCFGIHQIDALVQCKDDMKRIVKVLDIEVNEDESNDIIERGIVLVGCQMDRMYHPDPDTEDDCNVMEENRQHANEFSLKWNIPFIETSAKSDINVELLFQQIVYEYWLQTQCRTINWRFVSNSEGIRIGVFGHYHFYYLFQVN